MDDTDVLLTQGLLGGFAGGTVRKGSKRGGFAIESSHYEAKNGEYYDEWAASRSGGGQELVRSGDTRYTRLYAGGTTNPTILKNLGITEKDVIDVLVQQLKKLGSRTRLHAPCGPIITGDWEYRYEILEKIPNVAMTVGKESVMYKSELVFVHVFLLCPVE